MLRMVLGVGIVRMVYRRVRLRRDVVLVMVLTLPSSLMHGHGRRDVRAWHHGQPLLRLPSQSALARDQATNCEGVGEALDWSLSPYIIPAALCPGLSQ
jgi:hypothetical protein